MTTDITELAQREKFEAWLSPRWNMEKFIDDDGDEQYVEDYVQGAWIGFNAVNAELVEALEKAQQRIASQREYYEGVIADGGKRIAELESRTVKLPPCVDDLHGIGMVMSADAVVEALTSYGIKVEAE